MGGDQYGWLRAAVSQFGGMCKVKLSGGGGQAAAIRGPLDVLCGNTLGTRGSCAAGPRREPTRAPWFYGELTVMDPV